ncbi:MAG: glycine cleavage system aminomethyltransferase GcvT [Planctomycetaceae bacterium]|nr:MAG: glycine cleavage system aminomethyltransferase GcvT [Planctomycetaceae bacterium]
MTKKNEGAFEFSQAVTEPCGSVLFSKHLELINRSRLADFAGYLMPLWFSSISAEHKAVRETAGLFDCTHMGVLEVSGDDAGEFLNVIATNDVTKLIDGKAQYSYILDAAGNVLDDIIIYRINDKKFMVVVNASNEPKIKAYIQAVLDAQVVINIKNPGKAINMKPVVRNLRDPSCGAEQRVDIALQGPVSVDIISELIEKAVVKKFRELKPFTFIETKIKDIDVILSRTGYTGAKNSYEIYVHPDNAGEIWDMILTSGKDTGVLPCGLGSRDSLRIEAGLPLYGHELAGEFNINPFEAGYGWAVKLEKKFFIGQDAMREKAAGQSMKVVRIALPGEKGVRPARQNDGVLNSKGECAGWVLSCAKASEKQYSLCYVKIDEMNEGDKANVYYLARSKGQVENGKKEKVQPGDILKANIDGEVVKRFERF